MTTQSADVVVIGGGITGIGIARDAALRGFKVLLIERSTLGAGTSGRTHGLLHSGARYAVNDPVTARECIKENYILRNIAHGAILDTGGFFLAISDEEVDYSDTLYEACLSTGIPVEEVAIEQAIEQEPVLSRSPTLKRVLKVPDGYVDTAKLIQLNKTAAEQAAVPALILVHHQVIGFHRNRGYIEAVLVKDLQTGQNKVIECQFVINAAGIWADKIGAMAGVSIALQADKGIMVVFEKQISRTVLNRCRRPGDGDILVPTGQHSVFGTTSTKTDEIDSPQVEQSELIGVLRKGDLMVPGISSLKIKSVYAGVRPLFSSLPLAADSSKNARNMSRSYLVINHAHDGVNNLISVLGGKATTYRSMAEKAVSLMCIKIGSSSQSQTSEVALS